MFSYSPRVHNFLLPIACFALGQYALGTSWRFFGIVVYVLGAGVAFVIGYAIVKDSQWHHSNDEAQPLSVEEMRTGEPVKIALYETQNNIKYFDLPATHEQLRQLVPALLSGDRFTVARWSGRGRPFSRDRLEELRSVMLTRKWIEQANPKSVNDGFIVTAPGEKALTRLAHYLFPPPPSPTETGAVQDPAY